MARDWQTVLAEHRDVIIQMTQVGPALDAIVESIVRCFRSGGRVYIFGNGGSAADAQHIAAELLGRFKLERAALPALALTTDSSALTAIANDLGYEQCFARQLQGLVRPGDVVWALSTSGRSPNILEALRTAAALGATTIGFTGASGEEFARLCTHAVRVPHTAAERIQEAHELVYHYICECVEDAFADGE